MLSDSEKKDYQIDPSIMLLNPQDRRAGHNLFMNYLNGYDMTPDSIRGNKKFQLALEQSMEGYVPSRGARFWMNVTVGSALSTFLDAYLEENHGVKPNTLAYCSIDSELRRNVFSSVKCDSEKLFIVDKYMQLRRSIDDSLASLYDIMRNGVMIPGESNVEFVYK